MTDSLSDRREEGSVPEPGAAPKVALALGMSGAIGEAMLAALVAAPRYSWVHVGHRHAAGAGASKFRPWVIGSSVIVAEDAYVVLSEDAEAPSPSPIRRFGPKNVVRAATIARDTGARRLVVIEPAKVVISSADETEIDALGFDTVLIVQVGDPRAATAGRGLLAFVGLKRSAVSPAQLASAIIRELPSARPGLHRLDANDLRASALRHPH